jgi:drug/metabolite transporter (DMT)-like permease
LPFFREQITFQQIQEGIIPILYAGVMSCGVAYTFQIIGQKHMEPAIASLLLSSGSGGICNCWFSYFRPKINSTGVKWMFIVFAAVILAQLPFHKKTSQEEIVREDEAA